VLETVVKDDQLAGKILTGQLSGFQPVLAGNDDARKAPRQHHRLIADLGRSRPDFSSDANRRWV